MGKKNKDNPDSLPMYHQGDFYCEIRDYSTYKKVLSGDSSIPERCKAVKIPVPVFNALVEGQDLLVEDEQGLLGHLPCKVGAPVYWYWCWQEDKGEDDVYGKVHEAIVTEFHIKNLGDMPRVLIDTGNEGGGIIGSIGYNPDYESFVFLSKEAAEESLGLTGGKIEEVD